MIGRREFLKTGALGAASMLLPPRPSRAAGRRDLILRPYPHADMPALKFVYASDMNEDPFVSSVDITRDGIVVPPSMLDTPLSINARWYVHGFGYLWLSADNGGAFYSKETLANDSPLNLSVEFARSRVARNRTVVLRYERGGSSFSPEVRHLMDLSEELLDRAKHPSQSGEQAAFTADRALYYALCAGETIELENAGDVIRRSSAPRPILLGCESRQIVWAKSEEFMKRFTEVFNFATITHYISDSWYQPFEPFEGKYNWGIKDDILRWLADNDIPAQGRPLFWFHPSVTPDWLAKKSFKELKLYVERHTRDLVAHYGDRVLQWEVLNEYHDWANIHNHTPDQTTEITRLACDCVKDTNPHVQRILNNCAPWGEYVARGRMARMDATRPLRSPRKFIEDLATAGVEYDVLGIQLYYPQRDLSDIARLLERFAAFGKPIYITETGASSNLRSPTSTGALTAASDEPYSWHREWDEELQADWLEQVYTLCYSRRDIQAINWYDFSDFRPYIVNGGLVREDCTPKASFRRLGSLGKQWNVTRNSKGRGQ